MAQQAFNASSSQPNQSVHLSIHQSTWTNPKISAFGQAISTTWFPWSSKLNSGHVFWMASWQIFYEYVWWLAPTSWMDMDTLSPNDFSYVVQAMCINTIKISSISISINIFDVIYIYIFIYIYISCLGLHVYLCFSAGKHPQTYLSQSSQSRKICRSTYPMSPPMAHWHTFRCLKSHWLSGGHI